jgi:hypothetical protein
MKITNSSKRTGLPQKAFPGKGKAIMRKSAALLGAAFLLILSAVSAQTLSELAEKEKNRRKEITTDAKVITNKNAKFEGPVTTMQPLSDDTAKKPAEIKEEPATPAQAKPAEQKSDEPVDFQGRPESFWRKTASEARQKVKDLENESTTLTLRLNQLKTKFYNISDGFAREAVQREIQKTYYEQDLNKENLAKARKALDELENDAQRSGALPGWIGK